MKAGLVVDNEYVFEEEKNLTVRKTSLFFPGDGFTVYNCQAELIFRVDSYGPDARDRDEIVLTDANGRCLLTAKRKRPSLHNRWEGFRGEKSEGQKPIFSVRRSSIIGRSGATVEVYGIPGAEYQIEGSFAQRSCMIYDAGSKQSVAEIKRKVDLSTNMMLGKDVFCLSLKPGFDGAFVMGLIIVLDQIDGDDSLEIDVDGEQVHPTALN